jgi:hypothetical protein
MTKAKNVLLVEGNDDYHVLYHLLQHHNITLWKDSYDDDHILADNDILVIASDGIDKLLKNSRYITNILKRSGLERLGIVIDADTDLLGRWQSLSHRLALAGYTDIPPRPAADGTIITQQHKPPVGVWLMPNNQLTGMLEDFVGLLVPGGEHNVLWNHAHTCLDQLPAQHDLPANEERFAAPHYAKAHIHTWLAWQKEPGRPLGVAIKSRYLDTQATGASSFVAWLQQLFDLSIKMG